MIPFQDKLPIVAKATLPTYGSLCNYESSIPVTSSLNVLLSQAIQILVMPRILLPKRNHKVESWSDNQPVLFMGVGMQLLEPTNGKIVLVPPDWKKCAGTPMSYTTNKFKILDCGLFCFKLIQTFKNTFRLCHYFIWILKQWGIEMFAACP